ncbi:Sin3-associated polypeptide p18 [Hyphodiscus hymeniophilus]|uniref:Sin3-associated polypeptide p18 n=1 Tax=Hyphodiscus hymeniophilus TaxID=353542 RepID=A0A9P6VFM1_9HELO|nr:Sin3-associated polypeptide p18 [Hyphodiscus hymeniophilus]
MATAPVKIDRQTTTPFHLKLFYRNGSFHRTDEFNPLGDLPPHLQIYTWQSCTLRELAHLLTSALPSLLPDPAIGTRLAFKLIFPDTRREAASGPGRFITKELGSVVIGDDGPGILPDEEEAAIVAGGQVAGSLGGEPDKTLQDAKFVIGDYIACAILPALANGAVAPPPARGPFGRGGGDFGGNRMVPGGPRENGFGFRGRGGPRGGGGFGQGVGSVPSGEWRRGERVPEGPSGGRGRGYAGGFGGGRGRW